MTSVLVLTIDRALPSQVPQLFYADRRSFCQGKADHNIHAESKSAMFEAPSISHVNGTGQTQ